MENLLLALFVLAVVVNGRQAHGLRENFLEKARLQFLWSIIGGFTLRQSSWVWFADHRS